MSLLRIVVSILLLEELFAGASVAYGQPYPNKPIRIVTGGISGQSDFVARQVGQALTGGLGQQAIVDSRGSGVIPGQIVSKAPPDGYTLLVGGSTFIIGPLMRKAPYDPVKDFVPISLVASTPNVLLVHPSVPAKSVRELITLAKARPGALNYASGGTGGTPHLAAELFKSMAGVNIVRISYKDSATQMADLIGGQVQLTFGTASGVSPYIKSGRLRALAVTSAEPSGLLPDLPTVSTSGVPGYESVSMTGVFAPAKTSVMLVNLLNQQVVRHLNMGETKERFLSVGAEAIGNSPEQYAAAIDAEIARMGKVIKDAGISAE